MFLVTKYVYHSYHIIIIKCEFAHKTQNITEGDERQSTCRELGKSKCRVLCLNLFFSLVNSNVGLGVGERNEEQRIMAQMPEDALMRPVAFYVSFKNSEVQISYYWEKETLYVEKYLSGVVPFRKN